MTRKLRIPNEDEIKAVLKWGGIRILIALPQAALYSLKQLSRLTLHCSSSLENIYYIAVVEPFDALIWSELPMRVIEAEVMPELNGKPELFDWNLFKADSDRFPHIRIIAKSGMGKTTLAEWLLSILGGERFVITPKKKPSDWRGYKVYGAGFNFEECAEKMASIKQEMYQRFDEMEAGKDHGFINFVADEWRLVVKKSPEAKDDMKEVITVARDAKIRMIGIAQGEQVGIWGLEGESDLEECFTTIRMGQFAIDHAKKLKLPQSVLEWLRQQKRPCMVENQPAEVPDLSNYNPVLTQLQASSEPTAKNTPSNDPEPLQNGGFSVQNQISEELIWAQIQGALLSDPARSPDWLAKNLLMPQLSVGRPRALEILADLRQKFGNESMTTQ
jgi:hypothetical protein